MESVSRLTFSQFLNESPIPDDWDSDIYNERIPFARRIKYAQERARRLGAGSSRIAFVIPYQGRDTVLKIAKNSKGMAQNEAEAQLFDDYYLKDSGIFIPMIDYDEKSSLPTWIHTEMATKAKQSDFKRETGGTVEEVFRYLQHRKEERSGKRQQYSGAYRKPDHLDTESELISAMEDYIGNYDPNISDYGRLANWGVYKGSLVIIDAGLTDDVYSSHYAK